MIKKTMTVIHPYPKSDTYIYSCSLGTVRVLNNSGKEILVIFTMKQD